MVLSRRFRWTPGDSSEGRFSITLPFDPKEAFGKARVPVIVTIGGFSYRSTIAHMGGPPFVPFRTSHREAAGVVAGRDYEVELTLDEEERTVAMPEDLATAVRALPNGQATWDAMSFTHRREFVEAVADAKRPETRAKRIEKAVAFVAGRIKG